MKEEVEGEEEVTVSAPLESPSMLRPISLNLGTSQHHLLPTGVRLRDVTFEDEEKKKRFTCLICQELLKPMVKQTKCGHRFCEFCIHDHMTNTGETFCPGGEEDCIILAPATVFTDTGIMREIAGLSVVCKHGCGAQVKMKHLVDHEAACISPARIPCANAGYGCTAVFSNGSSEELAVHQNTCNVSRCKHCKKVMLSTEVTDHEAVCEQLPRSNQFQVRDGEEKETETIFIWKIENYSRHKENAVQGRVLSLLSQPFFTSVFGYKMRARMYLNGDGIGKGTHLSVFIEIMKGDYDAVLAWPFKNNLTITLMDQANGERNLSETIRPDTTASRVIRPPSECNIAARCPLFASIPTAEGFPYLKDDSLCIQISMASSASYIYDEELPINPLPHAIGNVDDVQEAIGMLEIQNEESRSRMICKKCAETEATIVLLPCRHLVCCATCAPNVMNCPTCKIQVERYENINY